MSQIDRKSLTREYKETPREAGVFRVRNRESGKALVGSSPDLPGMLNRQRFQLELGSHADKELQADWNALGSDSFEFDVLDRLEPRDDAAAVSQKEELEALAVMWSEKLRESGVELYPCSPRSAAK